MASRQVLVGAMEVDEPANVDQPDNVDEPVTTSEQLDPPNLTMPNTSSAGMF